MFFAISLPRETQVDEVLIIVKIVMKSLWDKIVSSISFLRKILQFFNAMGPFRLRIIKMDKIVIVILSTCIP